MVAGSGIHLTGGTTEIVNVGVITGGTGSGGYGILNDAGDGLSRLENGQGGGEFGITALTYAGDYLPDTYEVVLSSPTRYGQLDVYTLDPENAMTVGISANSPDLSTHTYGLAIQGVSASDITNEETVLEVQPGLGVLGSYVASAEPGATDIDWDVRIWNYAADWAEPQHYVLDANAARLRNAMTYDCTMPDGSKVCLTGSLQQSTIAADYGVADASGQVSGTVAGAFRLGENVQVGGMLSVGNPSFDIAGLDVSGTAPTVGVFLDYAAHANGTGLQSHIATAYQRMDANFARANLLGDDLSVQSEGTFETRGLSATTGWGFALGAQTTLTPYIGFASTQSTRAAFGENASVGVQDPFGYGSFSTSQVTGTSGVKMTAQVSNELAFRVGAAVDRVLSYSVDSFDVTGDNFGTSSYQSELSPDNWRVMGSAGMSYQFAPNKSVNLDGVVSQGEDSGNTYSVSLGLKIGY